MPHLPDLFRRLRAFGLTAAMAFMLAGCQFGAPAAGPAAGVTPNAVVGDPIEVTALEDPALPPPVTAIGDVPGPETDLTDAPADLPAPDGEATSDVGAASADAAAEAAPPVEPPGPEQLACEKKGGAWSSVGLGSLKTCIFNTRDSGKRCDRESDCEGVCLARSRTCAPVRPLLGCNDILQDNGARVTLCIE